MSHPRIGAAVHIGARHGNVRRTVSQCGDLMVEVTWADGAPRSWHRITELIVIAD